MSKTIKELEEIADLISIAIAREKTSIEFYTSAYNKATAENAKRIFSLLIEQEKGHEAKLRAQLHELKSEIELERLKIEKRVN